MFGYVLKRLFSSTLIILALSAIVFITTRTLLSGNEATSLAGPKASAADVAAIAHKLGLDQPIVLQYLGWLSKVVRGDFGVSPLSGQSNSDLIAQQAPISLELAVFSLIITVAIGIPIGVLTAGSSGKRSDWGTRIPLLVAFAIPGFVSGALLLLVATRYIPALYSAVYIPFGDDPLGNLQMMFLPALSVGIPTSALIAQMTRSSMLEVLSQPHIATARTHGIPEWKIKYVYALKASLPPILTLVGVVFGLLIGSLFITEDIFSLPGLGRGVLDAISSRDVGALEAQVVVMAALFILGNLIVDIVIPMVDRRIVRD